MGDWPKAPDWPKQPDWPKAPPKIDPNYNPEAGAKQLPGQVARMTSLAWGIMGAGILVAGGLAWSINTWKKSKDAKENSTA